MEKFVYSRRKIRFCSSVSGNELQANAVELAQLGEVDDSPQCGEMSRRDKRARHPLKMEGKLPSLTEVLIRHYCNLRRTSELLFAVLKA